MFLFGPPNVEKMKARRNVKGLIKATGYTKDSGQIRQSAILALIEMGELAVKPLIRALKDKREIVREAAVEALCKIGAPAVESLIAALKDPSVDVRKAAARILGNIGDARAVKPLIDALNDADPHVRITVAGALGQLGAESAIRPLLSVLQDENSDVRKAAAKALKSIGAVAVEQVVLGLKDADKDTRLASARALGEMGDVTTVEHLLGVLSGDPEPGVRAAAATSLGQLGDTCAVQPLIAALKDRDDGVGASAAEALGLLKDAEATGPLIDAFEKWAKKGSTGAIEKAARALGRLGYNAIVAPLLLMCEERNLLLAAAVVGLKESLESASKGLREESLRKLAATQAVAKALEEKERQIKREALPVVQRLRGEYQKSEQKPKDDADATVRSPKHRFESYSGSGICDVCNRSFGPGEAYLVPANIFYNSKKYKEWVARTFGPMIQAAGGIEAYIAHMRAVDSTTHSAVCSECVHLFE